jgi:hypothetical protein
MALLPDPTEVKVPAPRPQLHPGPRPGVPPWAYWMFAVAMWCLGFLTATEIWLR